MTVLKKCIICFLMLVLSLQVMGQNQHFFIDKHNNDTIKDYEVFIYKGDKAKVFYPDNNRVRIDRKTIKGSDSIVLHFDYWYQERLTQSVFDSTNILIEKSMPLSAVNLSVQRDSVIGNYGKPYNHLGGRLSGIDGVSSTMGDLLSFDIRSLAYHKIKSIQYRIHRARPKNQQFIPIVFVANSIEDTDRIYLYPKDKIYTIDKKMRNEWLELPIDKKIPKDKSLLFVGYWNFPGKKLLFGRKDNKKGTEPFEDYFNGHKDAVDNEWVNDNRSKYYVNERHIPVIKVNLEK